MNIDILMASYNSEKYITEQIESILAQDNKEWQLIIRDDASCDRTPEIISKYAKKYPKQITAVISDKNCGSKANFNELLKLSEAPYIMFADHDDVWHPDKISLTFKKMTELETIYGKNAPLMVFTDKSLTDKDLNVTAISSANAEKLGVENLSLNKLLVQNVASGCTMMINKSLKQLCGDIHQEAIVHDYWLTLLAAAFGHIGYVDTPTMLYRQHSANEVGAKKYGISYIFNKLQKNNRKNIEHNIRQAKALLEKYKTKMPEQSASLIQEFAKLSDASPFEYRRIIICNKFFKTGFARNAALLMRLKN